MKIWFFVGDTFDWLESHATLSGVIRVTVELFFAAVSSHDKDNSTGVVPCVLTHSSEELAAVSLADTAAYLAYKTGRLLSSETAGASARPKANLSSRYLPDDVALFTGVIWTPAYEKLFRRLGARDIAFCLFIYDIIPIERPDLTSETYSKAFNTWLKTAVAEARIIFVSSRIIKDQILRWAALVGVAVEAQILPVAFGSTEGSTSNFGQDFTRNSVTSDSFVLSVGTIDKRKNQALLCKVWCRLISEFGERQVPQLVLVGRNDLEAGEWDEATAKAIQNFQIVILEGLTDQEVAALYRKCLFTVFPSLSEGYGLPVAESLGHGKLCLASALPTIKEHAGDLAWYFDPTDATDACNLIREAIENTDLRVAAEQRISQLYKRTSWASTFHMMVDAIKAKQVE